MLTVTCFPGFLMDAPLAANCAYKRPSNIGEGNLLYWGYKGEKQMAIIIMGYRPQLFGGVMFFQIRGGDDE